MLGIPSVRVQAAMSERSTERTGGSSRRAHREKPLPSKGSGGAFRGDGSDGQASIWSWPPPTSQPSSWGGAPSRLYPDGPGVGGLSGSFGFSSPKRLSPNLLRPPS